MGYGANNGNRKYPIAYPGIKKYMEEHDMSSNSVAEMCGISPNAFNMLLMGKTIRKSTADKLIAGTGWTYEQLFTR